MFICLLTNFMDNDIVKYIFTGIQVMTTVRGNNL
nr:MAG TPA_asm: hypothetical protein [Caudoviricetes sp.]